MKKVLRQALVTVLLFSILVLPAAWQSEAAATTLVNDASYYMFQNLESGEFMEVENGNIVVGANIQQTEFDPDSTIPLVFYLDWALTVDAPQSEDDIEYYYISPWLDLDLYFDVNNASPSVGANIKLFVFNPGYDAQSFTFIPNADGTFCIQPLLSSSFVLGAVDSGTTGPANVELVSYNASNVADSQKWILKRVKPGEMEYYSMNWSYFFRGEDAESVIRISQRYTNSGTDPHLAIDIVRKESDPNQTIIGTPVYSPFEGKVIAVGTDNTYGMGNYIFIRSTAKDSMGKQLTVRLMHLRDRPTIAPNTEIDPDDILGLVGNTGVGSGAHLHVDINNNGFLSGSQIDDNPYYAIDPEAFYPQIQFVYGLSASNAKYAN